MKSKKNISYKYKKKRKIRGGSAALTTMLQKSVKGAEKMATSETINQGLANKRGQGEKWMKNTKDMITEKKQMINDHITDLTKAGAGVTNPLLGKAMNAIGEDNIQNIASAGARYKTMPILMLVDLIKYTLLTVAGAFIYYPSFLVNIPNSTLEEIVPTKEGCKNLFGSEAICKTKIKCLIKKCSMFEDPEGFRLNQKTKKGGSKRKRITHKRKTVHPYLKPLPKSMIRKLNKIYKNDLKNAKKHYKTMLKYVKYGGKALKNENINMATCKNNHNQVLCSNRGKIDYTIPVNKDIIGLRNSLGGFGSFSQMGGGPNNKITLIINRKKPHQQGPSKEQLLMQQRVTKGYADASNEQNKLLESYIEEYLNGESCLKLLISYKALQNIFTSMKRYDIQKQTKKAIDAFANKTNSGIAIPFPWETSSATTTPEDRINCLVKHLTSVNLNDDEMTSDAYNKCFVCKNCTLLGTSMKVWDNLFTSMFTDSRSEFKNYVNVLYSTLKRAKAFSFGDNSVKAKDKKKDDEFNYYANSFYYTQKYTNNDTNKYKDQTNIVKDKVLGIPSNIKFSGLASMDDNMKDILLQIYATLEKLEIEKLLYEITFNLLYKKIMKEKKQEERIYLIKRSILDRYKLFWPNERIPEFHIKNSIDIDDMNRDMTDEFQFIAALKYKLKESEEEPEEENEEENAQQPGDENDAGDVQQSDDETDAQQPGDENEEEKTDMQGYNEHEEIEEEPVGLYEYEIDQYQRTKKYGHGSLPESDTSHEEAKMNLFEKRYSLSQREIDEMEFLKIKQSFLNYKEYVGSVQNVSMPSSFTRNQLKINRKENQRLRQLLTQKKTLNRGDQYEFDFLTKKQEIDKSLKKQYRLYNKKKTQEEIISKLLLNSDEKKRLDHLEEKIKNGINRLLKEKITPSKLGGSPIGLTKEEKEEYQRLKKGSHYHNGIDKPEIDKLSMFERKLTLSQPEIDEIDDLMNQRIDTLNPRQTNRLFLLKKKIEYGISNK